MYCTLSFKRVQVQTLPTEEAAPALTDSFSLGYDPYTHACKARPPTTVGRTSLSVIVIAEHAPSLVSDVVAGQPVSQEQGLCEFSTQQCPRKLVVRDRRSFARWFSRETSWVSEVVPKAPLPNTSSNNQGSVGDAHFSVIAIDTICLEIAFDVLMQGLEFCKNIGHLFDLSSKRGSSVLPLGPLHSEGYAHQEPAIVNVRRMEHSAVVCLVQDLEHVRPVGPRPPCSNNQGRQRRWP